MYGHRVAEGAATLETRMRNNCSNLKSIDVPSERRHLDVFTWKPGAGKSILRSTRPAHFRANGPHCRAPAAPRDGAARASAHVRVV